MRLVRFCLITFSIIWITFLSIKAESVSAFNNGAINEFVAWNDDSGRIINAHDGGIIYVSGTYYWYGMVLRALPVGKHGANGAATTVGISLYSSKDLYHWHSEGLILNCTDKVGNPLHGPMRFERPKIIFNDKTQQFVLWFHYVGFPGDHGENVGQGDAGVATASSIKGPFTFREIVRPVEGKASVKDCTLFKDQDGTAYFVYDHKDGENRCLYVVKLSDDYLKPTTTWSRLENCIRKEAPVLIKKNGYYYLITSDMSGWNPNPTHVYRSTRVLGPYEELPAPCSGPSSDISYNTQPTYAIERPGSSNEWILMTERHNTKNFVNCSYVWLPVVFNVQGNISLPYNKTWSY